MKGFLLDDLRYHLTNKGENYFRMFGQRPLRGGDTIVGYLYGEPRTLQEIIRFFGGVWDSREVGDLLSGLVEDGLVDFEVIE